MKKTPFSILGAALPVPVYGRVLPAVAVETLRRALAAMEHRKSLFTATKKDCRNPDQGWTDPLVGAVPGILSSALSGVGLWLFVHSCRSANFATTALQPGGCASIKRRDNVTHKFIIALLLIPLTLRQEKKQNPVTGAILEEWLNLDHFLQMDGPPHLSYIPVFQTQVSDIYIVVCTLV